MLSKISKHVMANLVYAIARNHQINVHPDKDGTQWSQFQPYCDERFMPSYRRQIPVNPLKKLKVDQEERFGANNLTFSQHASLHAPELFYVPPFNESNEAGLQRLYRTRCDVAPTGRIVSIPSVTREPKLKTKGIRGTPNQIYNTAFQARYNEMQKWGDYNSNYIFQLKRRQTRNA